MSYQKSFILALLVTVAVTLVVGLPRWCVRKWMPHKWVGLE